MLQRENKLRTLLELGLDRYEAKVYPVLVKKGVLTAKEISDITKIPCRKVDEIIESLSSKGFLMAIPSKPMKLWEIL